MKLRHIASEATFNSTKFSADSGNTTYYLGSNATQQSGTPTVLWADIAFCKEVGKIYTHGKFYAAAGGGAWVGTQTQYDALTSTDATKMYYITKS